MEKLFSVKLLLIVGITCGHVVNAFSSQDSITVYAADFIISETLRSIRQLDPKGFKKSQWNIMIPENELEIGAPKIVSNKDGSYTIFYGSLDDLITSIHEVHQKTNKSISKLNIMNHGMPGRFLIPPNREKIWSADFNMWRELNSLMTPEFNKKVMIDSHHLENDLTTHYDCQCDKKDWEKSLAKYPKFKDIFTEDLRLKFLSCNLGRGEAGKDFVEWLAPKILRSSKAKIFSITAFGYGGGNLNDGLAFVDYRPIEEMPLDYTYRPIDEIRINANVRLTSLDQNGLGVSKFIPNQRNLSFMDGEWPEFKGKSSLKQFLDLSDTFFKETGITLSNLEIVEFEKSMDLARILLKVIDSQDVIRKLRSQGIESIVISTETKKYDSSTRSKTLVLGENMSGFEIALFLMALPKTSNEVHEKAMSPESKVNSAVPCKKILKK